MITIESLSNELTNIQRQRDMHKDMFMQSLGAIQIIESQIATLKKDEEDKKEKEQEDGNVEHQSTEQAD